MENFKNQKPNFVKPQLFNDHFQNFKTYGIPHAQLIIADPPYNLGRKSFGFEIKKDFFKAANEKVLRYINPSLF